MTTKLMKANSLPFHFDLGLVLLTTGALSNITIWIGAFVSTETAGPVGVWVEQWLMPILGGISGLAMGFTVAVGLVYVIAKLNAMKPTVERKVAGKKKGTKNLKTMPNRRYVMGWAAIILLLVISPALLAPHVFRIMSGEKTLFDVLGSEWAKVWSVGRVLAADLAMGAVALVQGVHLPSNAPTSAQTGGATGGAQSGSQPARSAKPATVSATTAKELRPCDVSGCGVPYKWPQGKGAHYRQYHPDLIIKKGIPFKMTLPLEDSKKDGN
jgi:hypothetical protein